jgi:hypothetical protein
MQGLARRAFPFSEQIDFPPEIVSALDLAGSGDLGRGALEDKPGMRRAFKTPTLRDVARHPPYMHDGSLSTLEQVVRHYAAGCGDDVERDRRVRGFPATEADVADLVAFLEALTSERQPGRADRAWARRAGVTRLKFVDAEERPLAGLSVTFTPAGEPAGRTAAEPTPFTCVTDDRGRLQFPVSAHTHVKMDLPNGLAVRGGAWLPDTCREATLVVPVGGTARLALVVPPGLEAPETLNLWRIGGPQTATRTALVAVPGVGLPLGAAQAGRTVWPVNPEPWRFERQGLVDLGGSRTALYTGWCPHEGRDMLFRLEGQRSAQQVTLQPGETLRVDVVR